MKITPFEKEILGALMQDFAYEDTDWIPAFELADRLKKGHKKLSDAELLKSVRDLAKKHLIDWNPLERNGEYGYALRLNYMGRNQYVHNRPLLIRSS